MLEHLTDQAACCLYRFITGVMTSCIIDRFKIIDIAFSKLYGTVPLTPEVIKHAIDGYVPVVNLDYVCSIKDKDGNIIGFGVLVPSIAKALKHLTGRCFLLVCSICLKP